MPSRLFYYVRWGAAQCVGSRPVQCKLTVKGMVVILKAPVLKPRKFCFKHIETFNQKKKSARNGHTLKKNVLSKLHCTNFGAPWYEGFATAMNCQRTLHVSTSWPCADRDCNNSVNQAGNFLKDGLMNKAVLIRVLWDTRVKSSL